MRQSRHRRLTLLSLCVAPATIEAASSGFPATLPSPYSSTAHINSVEVVRAAAASSDDDDDDEYLLEDDSSDFEDALPEEHGFDVDEHDSIPVMEKDEWQQGATGNNLATQAMNSQQQHEQPLMVSSQEDTENDEEESSSSESPASSSQPLRTLQKLQHMLDSTDYMTVNPSLPTVPVHGPFHEDESWSDHGDVDTDQDDDDVVVPEPVMQAEASPPQPNNENRVTPVVQQQQQQPPQPITKPPRPAAQQDQLWTSKDRSKYKKQQQRFMAEKRRRRQFQSPPIHPNSDDDMTDDGDTEGDGLGYALPNLPVYYTDDEGGFSTDGLEIEPPTRITQQQLPASGQKQPTYNYPNPPYPYPDQAAAAQPPPPYVGYPPAGSYGPMSYPYGSYTPQQQQQMYAAAQQQHAAAWAASVGTTPPYGGPPLYPPWSSRSYRQQIPSSTAVNRRQPAATRNEATRDASNAKGSVVESSFPVVTSLHMDTAQVMPDAENAVTLAEAGSMINFDSLQKLSILLVGAVLLCYCAVSPSTLELVDYNERFKENIGIVALAFVAPLINFLFVFDARENDVNALVSTFYTSATAGYFFAFILELVLTTVLRLGVFALWEPKVFDLTPKVPALVLPWVLRENRYRPKRITLFVADFATSCVAGPIVEEYIKLKILQLSVRLPKNFKWSRKKSGKKGGKKRRVAEPITRCLGEQEVVKINNYVTEMLAASLGMKICDSVRRILMYTKERDLNKGFYAFCRGIFPIHELCGTMTALSLAKRDVLGVDMPLWKMLAPAVVIHGMANFRGKKPLFKWNSATPWSEMQLSPWNVADDSTFSQLLSKGFAKLMWLVILARVLGYCIKNYYLISRQAVKRTTTYAGKHAAFSAELAAAEMLKKKSKEK